MECLNAIMVNKWGGAMLKFDKDKNIQYTSKRPFHRVAIAYLCSRNTAKKYLKWGIAFTRYPCSNNSYNGWIVFENYQDYRNWKKIPKPPKNG